MGPRSLCVHTWRHGWFGDKTICPKENNYQRGIQLVPRSSDVRTLRHWRIFLNLLFETKIPGYWNNCFNNCHWDSYFIKRYIVAHNDTIIPVSDAMVTLTEMISHSRLHFQRQLKYWFQYARSAYSGTTHTCAASNQNTRNVNSHLCKFFYVN